MYIIQGVTERCDINVTTVSGDNNNSIYGNFIYKNALKTVIGVV